MPVQSKFIRFLKRCCCCSTNTTDTEINKGSNKSKQTKKNRKKLQQGERRERRAAKESKHNYDEKSFRKLTDNVGQKASANLVSNNSIKVSKQIQPSVSFPNLNDVKKRLIPLWKPQSMSNMLRSSRTSFLTRQNVTPAAESASQQSLHLSGHFKSMVSLNETEVTMEASTTSSSLSSWEELQIPPPIYLEIPPPTLLEGSCNCSLSTCSSSFSRGDWETVSINDILDDISPSLSSSFSTSSSFSFLEEDSTKRSGTCPPSPEINSASTLVSPSNEMNAPQSDQEDDEDYTVTDELPTQIVPKMKKFYFELWPPNPWLSPEYNGFPEEKKLKPHERDDYWTTDREGDPLLVKVGAQFTWCDVTGTVKVVRKYQESEVLKDVTSRQSNDEQINQTQSGANLPREDVISINRSADDRISTDDDSEASEEKVNLSPLSSGPVCSDDNLDDDSSIMKVKTRDALRQQPSGDDVLSAQQLNPVAMILSSIPTFPIDDMKCDTILKFHHPGHVYREHLFQFNMDPESFGTHSCAINHTLLVVTFYLFGLQSGDLLDSHSLQSTSIKKWLWKTIYAGNALHRSFFKRSKNILATEAFKVVKDNFRLHSLAWKTKYGDYGILSRRLRKVNLFLDIVHPYNLMSSLAYHATKLDPIKGEAILYTINRNFFVLVPTLDNRVVLIDIHPHVTSDGNAVILFCPRSTQSVQDMLDEFYLKTIKPFYNYCLGLANIICCTLNEDTKLIPRSIEEWISGI